MKREEARRLFNDEEIGLERQQMLQALDLYLERDGEHLIEAFVASFQELCLQISREQRAGGKGAVGYITYSMLRTEIAMGGSAYLVEATDANWYLDRTPIQVTYDGDWALQALDEMMIRLAHSAKSYMGLITPIELDRIRLREAGVVQRYVAALIRIAMRVAIVTSEFAEIEKEEEFEIRVGEYCDASVCVYREDRRLLLASDVKAWLNEKNAHEYTYHAFGSLDLSGCECDGMDFRYTAFRGTHLEGASFKQCVLMGTSWQSCDLVAANFSGSVIAGADYSGSSLQGAIFCDAVGISGRLDPEWSGPGLGGVIFRGCNLRGADFGDSLLDRADFRGANLDGANFRGTHMNNVLWAGASLAGAMFDKDMLLGLDLSETTGSPELWHTDSEVQQHLTAEKEGVH
ncbi:pentapeptide repeat-containing protein [Paenibacillus sp. IHBB 10380]|uniref:pentapeptide repeat-containing protein n=1 Tax=Paenibacillus sp. IHBB 10380 TaxID=1566358 RepID=UPI000696D103|nr:pentapeptide repeat-containing protein [Paenibacillus sp. IHBB 10380]